MSNNLIINEIKCILVGDSFVGKTSLIWRFINNIFYETMKETNISTYYSELIDRGNYIYKINIWDISNKTINDSLVNLYFKSTDIALVVYDCLNNNSRSNVLYWIKRIKKYSPRDIKINIICNKIDLSPDFNESDDFINKLQKFKCKIFYTSAKLNINIKEIFYNIIEDFKEIKDFKENYIKINSTISIDLKRKKFNRKNKCC